MDFFSATNPFPPLLIALVALVSAHLLAPKATSQHQEFAAIDGLRGFLALAVFIHHTTFWFNFARGHGWTGNGSGLYMNFGQASISLFFMLTGFLFTLKLLAGRERPINWLQLYCSRIMRLCPLYFCVVLAVVTIVVIDSGAVSYEPTEALRSQIIDWILFTVPGHPDINTLAQTELIVAGVTWTLGYEWYFYLLLPVLALLFGGKNQNTPAPWLLFSAICLLSFSAWHLDLTLFYAFAGGAIAAILARTPWFAAMVKGPGASWVVLMGLVMSYASFGGVHNWPRLIIFTLVLALIACGADIFGLLTLRAARALSTFSYGIYLLHGLVLYGVFHYVVPNQWATTMSIHQYWGIIIAVVPVLVGVAALSWRFIEAPGIQAAPRLSRWITQWYSPSSAVLPAPAPVKSSTPSLEVTPQ